MVKRPSDDPLGKCGPCHQDNARTYALTLHFTAAGMKNGVSPRFSQAERGIYDAKVFEQSCRSCHSSCGDCHVQSPVVAGVNSGLLAGHRFVRGEQSRTCALCHGGRVWPEFTGDYGGTPDVHYRKGMSCTDCHGVGQMHGDGTAYPGRRAVRNRPSCRDCHDLAILGRPATREAHASHVEKVSCTACHTASAYRQCANCHLDSGATSSPAIVLGKSPRPPGRFTTLRLIPNVRDTFRKVGIAQANYDALPNYWDAVPHNIAKRTDRTRDCDTCHADSSYYLEVDRIPQGLSRKNLELAH